MSLHKRPHEQSHTRVPHTNGIFERNVQYVSDGTRTLLVAAGLPSYALVMCR